MTQKQKDLLLKDLCGRLPYGVKVLYEENIYRISEISIFNETITIWGEKGYPIEVEIQKVKPYLFPMSSMTEKQRKEWQLLIIKDSYGILYYTVESFDYLYKNHIDIRGFISEGLAIDATGKNIY